MFKLFKKKLKNLFKKTSEEIQEEKPEVTKPKEKKVLGIFKTTVKLEEKTFNKFFKELEEILIENNTAIEAIDIIKKELKEKLVDKEIKRSELEKTIKESLKEAIETLLLEPFNLIDKIKGKKPYTIVFFGINGSGKTTTIARIAWLLKQKGIASVFAASDTFRAASIEQLEKHSEKLGIKMIKHKYGADPAAVAFDAVAHAKAHHLDTVLIDTAGRIHTKTDLLKEMEKIVRVAKPDLKIFVAESITGNDAVEQVKRFDKAVGIDAIILTKADVDERGGTAISVSKVTNRPILFLGTGQEYKDLEIFDKKKIIESLFS
ncbi:MAG: signal recognition particle-docking protein FtsY [archaeon]|nr:MAG: signal recognition particle-docking protein FtsY [archaeon]